MKSSFTSRNNVGINAVRIFLRLLWKLQKAASCAICLATHSVIICGGDDLQENLVSLSRPCKCIFFFHVFFAYIDLLDESQTKLSSDLLDSRQSISQIQVIYIIISKEDQKWTQENFASILTMYNLSSFWIFFLMAIFVRLFFLPFLGKSKVCLWCGS